MAIRQFEYKEFFLTLANLPIVPLEPLKFPEEAPTNQDDPFQTREILISGVAYPTIFKTDNGKEPVFSDVIWEKFLKSITFKLNASDRALDSDDPRYWSQNPSNDPDARVVQGLVTVSTDVEAKAWNNGVELNYTRVPRVSQLPDVDETITMILSSVNFDITLIPASPANWITVDIDPAEDRRNRFLVRLSDAGIDWIRDSYNAIKTYVDSVWVFPNAGGSVIINGINGASSSNIDVTVTPPTPTDTRKFELRLNLNIDDDITLGANDPDRIPSQHAVREYINTVITGINLKANQIDLDSLEARVDIMQGNTGATLKANQIDFLALQADVLNKLWNNQDDTMDGNLTMGAGKQIIIPQDPVNNDNAARKIYVDNRDLLLLPLDGTRAMTGELILDGNPMTMLGATPKQYVDMRILRSGDTMTGHLSYAPLPTADAHYANKLYVDQRDTILQLQIDALEVRVQQLENLILNGLTGSFNLNRMSNITVESGIVKQVTT